MLGDELQADPAAVLSTSWTITSSTSPREITSSMWATRRADVGDVQQAVGALLQLDEGAELGRLDDAAGVGVPTSGSFVIDSTAAIAALAFSPSVA